MWKRHFLSCFFFFIQKTLFKEYKLHVLQIHKFRNTEILPTSPPSRPYSHPFPPPSPIAILSFYKGLFSVNFILMRLILHQVESSTEYGEGKTENKQTKNTVPTVKTRSVQNLITSQRGRFTPIDYLLGGRGISDKTLGCAQRLTIPTHGKSLG